MTGQSPGTAHTSPIHARTSLPWKLPVTAGLLVLAVVVTLSLAAYLEVKRSTRDAAGAKLTRAAGEIAGLLRTAMQGPLAPARALATSQPLTSFLRSQDPLTRAGAQRVIDETANRSARIVAIDLLDPRGTPIMSTSAQRERMPPLASADIAAALAGDDALVGRLRAVGDSVYFPTIAPITLDGEPAGLAVIWRKLVIDIRTTGERVFITNSEGDAGVVIVGSGDMPDIDTTAGVLRYRNDGVEYYAAAERLGTVPWSVVVASPEKVVMAPARRFLRRITVLAVLLALIGSAAAWYLTRGLIRPVRKLTSAADAMRAGDYSIRVNEDRQDELGGLAGAFNGMAERVENAHARLADQAKQYQMLFDNNPNPMWVFDRESLRFVAVNDAAVAHYGYTRDEFLRMTIKDIRPPEEVARLMQDIHEQHRGLDLSGVWTHLKKDGTPIGVEITSHDVEFAGRPAEIILARDRTEYHRLEEQFRHAQKMEAVGRLAGGVAHDFNNLLTVILGECDLALIDLAKDNPAVRPIEDIREAATKANLLTRQLLAFSRQQIVQPTVFEINDLVAGVDKLLRRLIGEDVTLRTLPAADAGSVRIDRGQLEQVLVNLAVNARDAMPDGGVLTIETDPVVLDRDYAAVNVEAAPGEYVALSVSDNGTGLSEELRSHMFEPFFTTKESGRGTGLGLSMCYGVVKQAGGHIDVYSEMGVGTTIKVYLPRVHDAATPATAPVHTQERRSAGERILLVEDQPAVRKVAARMLESLGYKVLTADSGEVALTILEDRAVPLDLLLTDVVLPGMRGGKLAEHARALRPELKVLFTSGYTGEVVAFQKLVDEDAALIQKPFTKEVLAERVRDALDSA